MEFFCNHRDRPGSTALREALLDEPLTYMDRYAAEMIARGPTLTSDGDTATGSVHILDLPDPAAARAFAFDEPQSRAGDHRACVWQPWGLRDAAPLRGRDELVAEVMNHVIGDSAVRPLDS